MPKFKRDDKVRVNSDCEGACERLKGKILVVQSSKEIVDYEMDGPQRKEVKTGDFSCSVLCEDTGLAEGVLESCLEIIQ